MLDQFCFYFSCFTFLLIWVSTEDIVSLHIVPFKSGKYNLNRKTLKIFLVSEPFKLECREVRFRIGQDKVITFFFSYCKVIQAENNKYMVPK